MNDQLKRACQYITNAGGKPTIAHFDEDHDPIGPRLRKQLQYAGLTMEIDGRIMLDPEYGEGTRGAVRHG